MSKIGKSIPAALCASAMACSMSVSAESYQTEFEFVYIDIEEVSAVDAEAKIYFSPIDTSKGPLAEAGFLSRGSYVQFGYADITQEVGNKDVDGDLKLFEFTYHIPNSKFFFGANYFTTDLEFSSIGAPSDSTKDAITPYIGIYLDDASTSAVWFEYLSDTTSSPFGAPDTDSEAYTLHAKKIFDIGGNALNIAGSVTRSNIDDNAGTEFSRSIFGVNADYYFNDKISLGIGLRNNEFLDVTQTGATVSVNTRLFLSNMLSLSVIAEKYTADEPNDSDSDTVRVALFVRL
ncbi:MAG: putative porin [Candidatus Thiodiazotropha sp. (ex Dulcina madagascariensis)]|nr:putative porin [Candidatus Thiodiazotropha sp. (ex Dulcina madagascariensis)]